MNPSERVLTNSQRSRLRRSQSGLLVVDFQERLLPAMFNAGAAVTGAARLIRGAAVLGRPVIVTEQYPRGLGHTVEQLASLIPSCAPIEKTVFSALGSPAVKAALDNSGVMDVVLCGIEAHVCVYQTCMDLLNGGYQVFVAADAVGSRSPENCRIGIERMRDAGAAIVSVEMALFDLLGEAGTAEFKQILGLVK